MSTTLAPFGMRPVFHPSGLVRAHAIPGGITSGYATALYQGTPVTINTSGNVVIAANAADFVGCFDGVEYTDSNGRRQFSKYWTASLTATDIIAYIYDDPLIVYEMQAEGSLAQTAVGDQANFSTTNPRAVGDGSTIPGTSTTALSTTLAGAASQGMVRVLDKGRYVDNDWGDTYTIVQVQVARHIYVSNKVAI